MSPGSTICKTGLLCPNALLLAELGCSLRLPAWTHIGASAGVRLPVHGNLLDGAGLLSFSRLSLTLSNAWLLCTVSLLSAALASSLGLPCQAFGGVSAGGGLPTWLAARCALLGSARLFKVQRLQCMSQSSYILREAALQHSNIFVSQLRTNVPKQCNF
jgi:hypothetical protein